LAKKAKRKSERSVGRQVIRTKRRSDPAGDEAGLRDFEKVSAGDAADKPEFLSCP